MWCGRGISNSLFLFQLGLIVNLCDLSRLLLKQSCCSLLRYSILEQRNLRQYSVDLSLHFSHTLSKFVCFTELLIHTRLGHIEILTDSFCLHRELLSHSITLLGAMLLLFHLFFPEVAQIREIARQAQHVSAVPKQIRLCAL